MNDQVINDILIIHTQSALNALAGKEALDLSLIFGAFDQRVSVLFLGLGVTQCLIEQTPELIGQKDYLSTFKLLEMYDIEETFVCQKSLNKLGFHKKNVMPSVLTLDPGGIIQLKQNAKHIYVI
ncbi:sulfurtransferase complex subunit TusC [Psychrosphaera sp. B3R10]|uniref:sulfurtransferase complex subunit TusC n=1 Tax=unclassified Psychrosphaera TaxID=2641570 RepID=UPI001C089CDE|nr:MULTISPECIES: sulfurtransferase complex subunit TusC [unclassified Psychrosphaera]MBU2880883.1 sulfurtransferase complex subunit TusC [Psychrosphaera sp. I2R16]MBU2990898.1 sulfurtransferase complex subunit TusC [Psychrosphaera sp. B3R10]MDO6720594.1 sulfurtransferase complex subunit TusC [Psychrosphaera sp. 1_MG-2023]